MKDSLNQKLKTYGALATGVIAIGNVADAQTIYTDIDPDSLLTGNMSEYLLDLNNDGIKDYRIITVEIQSSSSGVNYNIKGAGVYPMNGNEILVSQGGSSSTNYIKPLDANSPIGPNQTIWDYTSSAFLLNLTAKITYMGVPNTYERGLWDNVQDKYMAVRFKINGNSHYGWVRMDVNDNGDEVVIKSYAYNSTANASLNAGATGVGIADMVLPTDYKIFMNGSSLNIDFAEELSTKANIKIYDQSGKLVKDEILANQKNTMNLDIAAGIYMVNLIIDGTVITEKIVVE